jgi:chloramphenicol-sensitive protein RarD
MTTPSPRPDRAALLAAIGCFVSWGLFPLLFQAAGRAGAGAWEVVGWRVLAALPWLFLMVGLSGQLPALRAVARQPRVLGLLTATALLIGGNWGAYTWAVQNGHTLATSFGYYLNPLLNMLVGAWLFRERLGLAARVAIGLAVVGVALQAVATGGLPWIALFIGGTFCAYGVIRKQVAVEAQTGLLVETLVLTLPSAAFVGWELAHGTGAFGHNTTATGLLLLNGLLSVIPLVAFSFAARRLPLSLIGFLQFIQPTILFGVGALQGEPVTALRLASFGFIWVGVAVFVAGLIGAARRRAL